MEALLIEASFFRLFQKACFFKARINPQFNRPGKYKGGLVLRKKLYPYKNLSDSPASSTFSFNRLSNSNVEVLTIGNNKESTSEQHKLVILMIKFLQEGDYYLSLLTVVHSFCIRVQIT